jgi:subtilase family serine protease
MLLHRFFSCVSLGTSLAIGALSGIGAGAQNSVIHPRINGPVDESSLTTLPGNVVPNARPEFDKGEAAPSAELAFIRLVLSRSPEQESALEHFMAQQLDKSSPNYHRWLTPEQFGRLYGPADSDIAAVVAWLQSHGLRVQPVSAGRTNIAFSGTVSQVEEAFHASIHSFDDHSEQFLSNTSDPRIPSALAPVISGVAQLNTIRPRPYSVPARPGQFDPASHRLVPVNGSSSGPEPAFTVGSAPPYSFFMVPADAATIYDTPNSFNANFTSAGGTAYDGTGVTIGIVGDALIQASTVVDYRSRFLNDSTTPAITNVGNTAVAGQDTDEGYVDVEIAGGLAPKASLIFYTSGGPTGLQNAIEQALTDNKADILSVSFGACELANTTAGNTLINGWWQQASAAGVAVVVATGDSGSAGCDNNTETTAINGLQVNGFASTPYNIAVGGTDFNSLLTSFTFYVNTTNSTSSSTPFESVKGYIPESTWNDSTKFDGLTSANAPFLDTNSKTNIIAGGGGASACSTNTTTNSAGGTCTSGYAKPSWQRGAGVLADGARDLPDVSLFAGNGFDAASWLVCTDDAFTGTGSTSGQTDNCVANSNNLFAFNAFGGTSTAAPAFAGILALVQSSTGSRLGLATKDLYDLFNGSHAGLVFNDVTVGNNSVVCTVSTPNCVKNAAGNYFLSDPTGSGYDTGTGYDLATGMGSVDVTQLINYWSTALGTAPATIAIAPSATSISSIQPLTVTVTVSGSSGFSTPTGTVTLSGGGYSSSPATLTAGIASLSIPAGSLQTGNDVLTVTYSGDVDYATTSNATTVTVTMVAFTLSATQPSSVTPGAPASSTLTVSTSNNYSGSIALTCAVTTIPAGAVDPPGCTISPTAITLSSSATTGTATVSFTTTAPIASLARPHIGDWESATGAVLALLVFFGIPSRRRGWRSLVGLLFVSTALAGLSACGGGSSGGGHSNPGTTAGTYVFTVTGTGTPDVAPVPTTISLTVN